MGAGSDRSQQFQMMRNVSDSLGRARGDSGTAPFSVGELPDPIGSHYLELFYGAARIRRSR